MLNLPGADSNRQIQQLKNTMANMQRQIKVLQGQSNLGAADRQLKIDNLDITTRSAWDKILSLQNVSIAYHDGDEETIILNANALFKDDLFFNHTSSFGGVDPDAMIILHPGRYELSYDIYTLTIATYAAFGIVETYLYDVTTSTKITNTVVTTTTFAANARTYNSNKYYVELIDNSHTYAMYIHLTNCDVTVYAGSRINIRKMLEYGRRSAG